MYIYSFFILIKTLVAQIPDTGMVRIPLPEDSTRFKIERLKINSVQSDFSPFIHENKLYFVSGRKRGFAVQYVDQKNNSEITDLYASEKVDSLHFTDPKAFGAPINSNYYEGSLCLGNNGNRIYYSANDKSSGKLKIYSSEKKKGKWGSPQMLPFCENNASYCHPALSADGTVMVFSSDINSDSSGMDLFLSRYSNNHWNNPEILQSNINSGANEVFPFLDRNNTLYFSSNKKGGMGGMDIYKVRLSSDSLVVPILLDSPMNSEADDFGVWIDNNREQGYFSSNRLTDSGDDIYYFYSFIPDFSESFPPPEKNSFCYTFYEENAVRLNDTLDSSYEWDYGDGNKARGLKTKYCYSKPGSYTIQLNVVEKNSGEISSNHTSYSLIVPEPEKPGIIAPDTAFAGEDLSLSSTKLNLKGFEILKTIWSFGDGKYNYGANANHVYRKAGEYAIGLYILTMNKQTHLTEKFRIVKPIHILVKDH